MIHIRLDDEVKQWAEQLSGAMGVSITEYIRRLILADVKSLSSEERQFLEGLRERQINEGVSRRTAERKKGQATR